MKQLKNIKLHWLLLAVSTISLLFALLSQGSVDNCKIVGWGISIATLLFILSGIAYHFRNISREWDTGKNHLLMMGAFFLVAFCYLFTKEPGTDDLQFGQKLYSNTLFGYLEHNHNCWSSRNIIEAVLAPLAMVPPIIWKFLTAIVSTVVAECITDLFILEKKQYSVIVYALAALLIPENMLSDAGWIATTLNYLWPLAAFLTVMLVVKKLLCKEPVTLYDKVQAIVLTLFATNMEVLSLAMLGTLTVLAGYQTFVKKTALKEWVETTNKFYFALFFVALAVFTFDVTAPGNAARSASEASSNFPEYLTFSILDKFELGFLSTMQYFYAGGFHNTINFSGSVLTLAVCLVLWEKGYKKVLLLQLLAIFVLVADQILVVKGNASWFIFANNQIPKAAEIGTAKAYLEIVLYIFIFSALLIGIYYAFDRSTKGLMASTVLLIGFCCRFALGFSPTAYVLRPFLFTIVAIIIVTTMLLTDYLSKNDALIGRFAFICIILVIYGIVITMSANYQTDTDTNIMKTAELVDQNELKKYSYKKTKTDMYKEGFHIDTNHREAVPEGNKLVCDKKYGLSLKGWAFDNESKMPLNTIYVVAGKRLMKGTYGTDRKDVSQAFGTRKNVGFNINIPLEYLTKEDGKLVDNLQFILVSDDESMYAPILYKIEDPDKTIDKLPTRPFESKEKNGFHIDNCNNKPQPEGDSTLLADPENGLAVSGWAVDRASGKAYGNMYVQIGEKLLPANYGTERKDVADFFKITDQNLGFTFNIPASELVENGKKVTEISIILVSPDEDYKYDPIQIKLK